MMQLKYKKIKLKSIYMIQLLFYTCYFRLLKSQLQKTNFSGVSGRVLFRDGERYLPTVEMKQHGFLSRVVTVGYLHPNLYETCGNNTGCLTINETSIYWPRGTRPTDGRSGKCYSHRVGLLIIYTISIFYYFAALLLHSKCN